MSIVVDTSAVIAIALDESDAPAIARVLADCDDATMSAVSLVEATIVAEAKLGSAGGVLVQRVIREARITIVDVTTDTALDAIDGWRDFGKGNHRAALNLGDCFTYALAQRSDSSVLCTGNDFRRSDVSVVEIGD